MGSGRTAVATGTTTGRTTGTRASSGRQAYMMPTSKPTSLTCWPKPARSRSTEGTEQPWTPAEPVTSGSGKRRMPPTNHCAVPSNQSVLQLGGASFLANHATQGELRAPPSPPIMALGGGGPLPPPPTLLWIRIFLLFKGPVVGWAGAPGTAYFQLRPDG